MKWIKATEEKPEIIDEEVLYDRETASISDKVTYEVSNELLICDQYCYCYIARYVRERDNDSNFIREYFELQDGDQLYLDDIYWTYISLPQELSS